MVNATEVGTYRSGMGNSPDPSTVQQSNSMPHQHGDSKGGSTAPGNTNETNSNQTASQTVLSPSAKVDRFIGIVSFAQNAKPLEITRFWDCVFNELGIDYFQDLLDKVENVVDIHIVFCEKDELVCNYSGCNNGEVMPDLHLTGLTVRDGDINGKYTVYLPRNGKHTIIPYLLDAEDCFSLDGEDSEDGGYLYYEYWMILGHEFGHVMNGLLGLVFNTNIENENSCHKRLNRVLQRKKMKTIKLDDVNDVVKGSKNDNAKSGHIDKAQRCIKTPRR